MIIRLDRFYDFFISVFQTFSLNSSPERPSHLMLQFSHFSGMPEHSPPKIWLKHEPKVFPDTGTSD